MMPLAAAKTTHISTVPTASPPGRRRGPHVKGLEQALGNARLFEHGAHENEQRNGREDVGGRDVVDLGNELEDGDGTEFG